jgi:DNA-binding beta-propeller fold protein YncE
MPLRFFTSRFCESAAAGAIALALLGACTKLELEPAAATGVNDSAAAAGPLIYPPAPATARFIHEATISSSADVVPETKADRLEQYAKGVGRNVEAIGKPFGLVVRHGRIYVSDTVRRLVHVLDRANGVYRQIGAQEPGRLTKPLGLAVDDGGKVYVSDVTTRRILIYDASGAFIAAVGGPSDLKRPSSVAVTPDGSRIYVLDTGGIDSTQHRIVVFDAGGQRVKVIGRRGAGPGQFNLPLSIERAPDGGLYVVDAGNFRVQKLTVDGAPVLSFGKPGRYPGQFGHPKDLALDADGNIYVTDASFGVFQIFNSSGRILLSVGERNEQGGRGRFLLPAGIDVDVDGRVYVADQYFRKIEVFRPAALSASTPPGGRAPAMRTGIAEKSVTFQPNSGRWFGNARE